MEYRRLGNSGLRVSPMCLGTARFGDEASAATVRRIVALAGDAGINFIDTADSYADGRSEEIVGKLIKGERDAWVVASKVGFAASGPPNRWGLGRKWILHQIEASLRRLGTDYVDIYYLHRDDYGTPMEEPVLAVGDIIRQGKARYFGISNYLGWRIAKIVDLCDRLGVPRPVACEPYYNALNRMAEVEILPACSHYGLGVVSYSPLSRGVLSGKYRPGAPPPKDSRVGRGNQRILGMDFREESVRLSQVIKVHAEARGMTAAQFAVNWVLNNRLVTSVIAGPRTLGHWREYLDALDRPFTAEDESLIDRLVASGHPSTPGFTDPEYLVRGRVARTA